MASLMALWLTLLAGLGMVFMPQVLAVLAPGFSGRGAGQMQLAVELTRIVFPYLVFICLTALVSGVLNVCGTGGIILFGAWIAGVISGVPAFPPGWQSPF